MMWWFFFFGLYFNILHLSVTDVFSNRYCSDMKPQSYVTIEQLMGMWYGVELISHKQNEEHSGIHYADSCPIIHISEDNSPTLPSFYAGYANYPYGTTKLDENTYGGGYQSTGQYPPGNTYGNVQNPYDQDYRQTYGQGQQQKDVYRGTTNYQGRQYGSNTYPQRYADDIKRLRLLWDEHGGYVEYNIRYNTSIPGFWMCSGPQSGSTLDHQYDDFAGTIQIIKAVGNHLVLTFCHRLPQQQLYTVILSRIPRLTRHEISDIHDLLTKRGLETHNIKKVCAQNSSKNTKASLVSLLLSFIVFYKTS